MIALAGLTILMVLIGGALAAGLVLVKAVVWLVVLPFRLLFYVLLLPLVLIKVVLAGLLMLVVAPVLVIAAVLGALAVAAAILVPLLPLAFIGFAIWMVVRLSRGAPATTTT